MTILKLLANNGFISYNKIIARHIGVHESIVLGELCSIANIFNYNEFYFNLEKISYDTALSDKQIRKAIKSLEFLGFLTVEKKGIPCKNWYTLNSNVILEFFEKYETENEQKRNSNSAFSAEQDMPKSKTSSAKSAELDKQKVPSSIGKNGAAREAKSAEHLKKNTRKNTDNNLNNNIGTSKKFQKPTLEEVKEYIQKNNYDVDAERFIDYYESNGWKVGKNPMKDWNACVRTWNKNTFGYTKKQNAMQMQDHPDDLGEILF